MGAIDRQQELSFGDRSRALNNHGLPQARIGLSHVILRKSRTRQFCLGSEPPHPEARSRFGPLGAGFIKTLILGPRDHVCASDPGNPEDPGGTRGSGLNPFERAPPGGNGT